MTCIYCEKLIGMPIITDINLLKSYSDGINTVALIHFTESNVTKMGMYDMLEHELRPWVIDYNTLEGSYHGNLQFAMSLYNNTKRIPDKLMEEDVIIWVGFQSNPGYWFGKGDAKSGFITKGIEPYDENGCFILDSHPEYRNTPNWVFEFITNTIIRSFD